MTDEQRPDEIAAETSLVKVSKSRVRVLKALKDQRRTASELARELDLNKSTVHGYLQEMVDEDLVERHEDDGRLWVYYTLSERGCQLVQQKQLRLVVDLTTLTGFLGASAIGLYRFLNPATPEPSSAGGPGIQTTPQPSAETGGLPLLMIAYVCLFVLAIAGWGLHLYLSRRMQEPSLA